MGRCFIFSAGDFYDLRAVPDQADLILAADGGLRLCEALGIRPHLAVGDFDSADAPAHIPALRLPVEKDDTDTVRAIREGLARGCTEFHLYGGTGGPRLDHTMANIQALAFLARHGAKGYLYDRDFVWTALENSTLTVPKTVEWGLLSVFALGERAEGVTLRGVQYPLTDGTLTCDFPLGVSNHILADSAHISVKAGLLLVGWQLPPLSG